MNRRDLLKNVATGSLTLLVVPSVISSCEKDDTDSGENNPENNELSINLLDSKYSALNKEGGSVVENNVIVANTGDGFIALSSLCTHEGCRVSYSHDNGNLPCPCHGSVFSTSGMVLEGPAGSALKKYTVNQEGDVLTIPL